MSNNMKNRYKEAFSSIYPSDEAIERIRNMPKNENKKRINFLPAVAAAACVAVFAVCMLAGGLPDDRREPTVSSVTNSRQGNSISKAALGFAMLAYADDKPIDMTGSMFNVTIPVKSKIGSIDIRGKSQHEIDGIVDDLYDDYNLVLWSFPSYEEEGKNVLTLLDTNTKAYDNAIIYQFRNGFFRPDIPSDNAEALESVKEIRVKNENRDAQMFITSLQVYYDDDGNLKDEYEMYSKGIHKCNDLDEDNMEYVVISGDEYRKCIALEKKHNKTMFGISWNMNTSLVAKMNDNPDYDCSQISDTVTLEVEFNNGTISQSVIDISFDKDGNMFAESKAFNIINK